MVDPLPETGQTTDQDRPPLGELADPSDQLDWDTTRHGRMRDAATPDDAVTTLPYERGD